MNVCLLGRVGAVSVNSTSEEIRSCLEHAEDCAQSARLSTDPRVQQDFLDLERKWRRLAGSFEFIEEVDIQVGTRNA